MAAQKYRDKKFYAVTGPDMNLYYTGADIEFTKQGLDATTPVLVELTVTRVFTRERDLKEIETEIN